MDNTQEHPVISARRSLIVALACLSTASREYERAVNVAEADRTLWQRKDAKSSRVRAQCVKELCETVVGADSKQQPKLMAVTVAQTAASDHPTYTAFKDELTELLVTKDQSANFEKVALQELECAKLDVEAKIELVRLARFEPELMRIENETPSSQLEEQFRGSLSLDRSSGGSSQGRTAQTDVAEDR